MRRRDFIVLLGGTATLRSVASFAQQPKVPAVGMLFVNDAAFQLRVFREGLRDLGYVDGHNIRLDIRSADGDPHRLPGLAAALVRENVDVIVAFFTDVILAARSATTEIPIVMMGAGDPLGMGLVASLAHPGGNITGTASAFPELAAKHVELFKEMLPNLHRMSALCRASDPFFRSFLEHVQLAGKVQQVEIIPIMASLDTDLDAAFPSMVAERVEAVVVQGSLADKRVAELGIKYRLPVASPFTTFPGNGGLMSYSGIAEDNFRGAAVFVDKILKGAKPADLPIQMPTRFKLSVNLKTAKALGLSIPQSILVRADEVIE